MTQYPRFDAVQDKLLLIQISGQIKIRPLNGFEWLEKLCEAIYQLYLILALHRVRSKNQLHSNNATSIAMLIVGVTFPALSMLVSSIFHRHGEGKERVLARS